MLSCLREKGRYVPPRLLRAIQRRRDGLPRKRLMSTLKQLELKGSRIGSASGNIPIPTAVRGSHLVPRLPKLQPPSPAAPPKHRSRAPLTVGLPPSSLASIALTKHQVDDAESSDLLVENMLRALIHMDSTPRSDVSSPLSPAGGPPPSGATSPTMTPSGSSTKAASTIHWSLVAFVRGTRTRIQRTDTHGESGAARTLSC